MGDLSVVQRLGATERGLLDAEGFVHRVRQLLSKYVCHRVIDRVMDANQHGTFGGEEAFANVLFADLSGFTGLAERFQPEQEMSILSRNLQAIVETIFRYDGAVLKLLGDGVLACFGVHLHETMTRRGQSVFIDRLNGVASKLGSCSPIK